MEVCVFDLEVKFNFQLTRKGRVAVMIMRDESVFTCEECGCEFEGVSFQVHDLNGTWNRCCYECKEMVACNAEIILGEDHDLGVVFLLLRH